MECKDYQNLIMLQSYHELDCEDAQILEVHLKTCTTCREDFEAYKLSFHLIQNLKASIPKNEDKSAAIDAILAKTRSREIATKKSVQAGRTITLLNSRIVRFTLNTAAVFLIVLFCYQQIQIKQSLKVLQMKVESQPVENPQMRPRYFPAEFSELSESQLESFLRAYNESLQENQDILNFLEENYPEIFRKVIQMQKQHTPVIYEQ